MPIYTVNPKEIREHGNATIIYFGHLRKIPMAVFMALALQLAEFIIFLIAVVGGQAFIRRLSQIMEYSFCIYANRHISSRSPADR